MIDLFAVIIPESPWKLKPKQNPAILAEFLADMEMLLSLDSRAFAAPGHQT
jgi:hypothetical protein